MMDGSMREALVNETKAMAHDGYTEPVRVTPAKRDYSDDPAMTGKITHRHHFIKGEQVARRMVGRIAQPVFKYECECGETEVR